MLADFDKLMFIKVVQCFSGTSFVLDENINSLQAYSELN